MPPRDSEQQALLYPPSPSLGSCCSTAASQWNVDFASLTVGIPNDIPEDQLKEYIYHHYKDEILRSMTIGSGAPPATMMIHQERSDLRKRLELLEKVAQVQQQYLQSEGPKVVYGHLLDGLLDLIGSEFGFIGEVGWDDGDMFLLVHASSNIAWDERTRKFYEENENMRFYNMQTLFGRYVKVFRCRLDCSKLPMSHISMFVEF